MHMITKGVFNHENVSYDFDVILRLKKIDLNSRVFKLTKFPIEVYLLLNKLMNKVYARHYIMPVHSIFLHVLECI